MTGVSVTVDSAEVDRALRAMAARLGDLRPAMELIGQAMVTEKDLGFRAQTDPWGNPWEKLKTETIAARRKHGVGAKILRDTGNLQNSITYSTDANSVVVGTNVEYAGPHQFGADYTRKARAGTVYFKQGKGGEIGNKFVKKSKSNFAQDVTIGPHSVHLPRRPFLPLDKAGNIDMPPDHIETILDILRGHLERHG